MRSNTQGVKRYFGAIWAVVALVTGIMVVAALLYDEPIPDYAFVIPIVTQVAMGGIIGFIQGATAMHAKQLDEIEAEKLDG